MANRPPSSREQRRDAGPRHAAPRTRRPDCSTAARPPARGFHCRSSVASSPLTRLTCPLPALTFRPEFPTVFGRLVRPQCAAKNLKNSFYPLVPVQLQLPGGTPPLRRAAGWGATPSPDGLRADPLLGRARFLY